MAPRIEIQRDPTNPVDSRAALMRGCDIDKPRNLAKSVTVE